MTRLLKCYGDYCEKHNRKHKKENLIKYKSKNYCKECYEKLVKEDEERDKLLNYIKNEYGISFVTPLMQKHIREMRSNGMSYKRIYALIYYCLHIKKNFRKPDMKYGLFTYTNHYEEMIRYYSERKKRRQNNAGKVNETRTLKIDSMEFYSNEYKDSKTIDMEDI